MDYAKKIGIAVGIALALYGGWQVTLGVRGVYADWVYVRASRLQAIRTYQQRAGAQKAPPPAPVEAPTP